MDLATLQAHADTVPGMAHLKGGLHWLATLTPAQKSTLNAIIERIRNAAPTQSRRAFLRLFEVLTECVWPGLCETFSQQAWIPHHWSLNRSWNDLITAWEIEAGQMDVFDAALRSAIPQEEVQDLLLASALSHIEMNFNTLVHEYQPPT